jgi:hypothetical protein
MTSGSSSKVDQSFGQLGKYISELVAVGVSDSSLSASNYTYARDRLDEVEQTEHGLHRKKWDLE